MQLFTQAGAFGSVEALKAWWKHNNSAIKPLAMLGENRVNTRELSPCVRKKKIGHNSYIEHKKLLLTNIR